MKNFLLLTFLLIGVELHTFAQDVTWAEIYGSTGDDRISKSIADGQGNTIICGSFSDYFVLGSYSFYSSGNLDAFVAKLDNNGDVLWAYQLGCASNAFAIALAVDDRGHVYFGGAYQYYAVFYSSTGNKSIQNTNGNYDNDFYLIHLNSDGDFVEGMYGNTPVISYVTSVCVAADYSVYSTYVRDETTAGEGLDAYLFRTGFNGKSTWSTDFTGSQNQVFYDVSVDGSKVLVGGYNVGLSYLDQGNISVSSIGQLDAIMVVYSTSGSYIKKQSYGNSGSAVLINDIWRNGNEIFVTGNYLGTYGSVSSSGAVNGFAQKVTLSASNTFSTDWIQTMNSSLAVYGEGITQNNSGNVYVTGRMTSDVTIDSKKYLGSSSTSTDIYVTRLSNSTGAYESGITANGSAGNDYVFGIAPNGNDVMITGSFYNKIKIGSQTYNSVGGGDAYLFNISDYNLELEEAFYERCQGDTASLFYNVGGVFDSGNKFTVQYANNSNFTGAKDLTTFSPSGKGSYTYMLPASLTPGEYYVRIISSAPAMVSQKMITHLVLQAPEKPTIIGKKTAIEFAKETYSTTFHAGSTYNWTVTGGNQIGGGTTNVVDIQWGGKGSGLVSVVEVAPSGCGSEAGELAVNVDVTIGMDELESKSITVYPTSAKIEIFVKYNKETSTPCQLFNANGQLVKTQIVNDGLNSIMVSDLAPGIYVVRISDYVGKFIKE